MNPGMSGLEIHFVELINKHSLSKTIIYSMLNKRDLSICLQRNEATNYKSDKIIISYIIFVEILWTLYHKFVFIR